MFAHKATHTQEGQQNFNVTLSNEDFFTLMDKITCPVTLNSAMAILWRCMLMRV